MIDADESHLTEQLLLDLGFTRTKGIIRNPGSIFPQKVSESWISSRSSRGYRLRVNVFDLTDSGMTLDLVKVNWFHAVHVIHLSAILPELVGPMPPQLLRDVADLFDISLKGRSPS